MRKSGEGGAGYFGRQQRNRKLRGKRHESFKCHREERELNVMSLRVRDRSLVLACRRPWGEVLVCGLRMEGRGDVGQEREGKGREGKGREGKGRE